MKQTVTLNRFYPHPPERIWRALTDPAALERWLMPTDTRPRQGRPFRFRSRAGKDNLGTVRCEVVKAEPPLRLTYTWQSDRDSAPSLVTWTLEPTEGGTLLRLEHTGIEAPMALAAHLEAHANWQGALDTTLPAVLGLLTARRRWIRGRVDLPDQQLVRCIGRERQEIGKRKERVTC